MLRLFKQGVEPLELQPVQGKQPVFAYETWMAQHRSLNGDQVCDNCCRCVLPRGVVRKAAERVAATQAKVARKVAEEKSARHR